MYVKDYNPEYDDIFLYDSSNSGYPIGLNPRHPLYYCKDSIASVCCRSRAYGEPTWLNPMFPGGITSGTPLWQYPQYYNCGSTLNIWASPTVLMGTVHFSVGGLPEDSEIQPVPFFAKKTESIASNTLYFFSDSTYTGFSAYGPFYNPYNYVLSSDLAGNTIGLIPRYFSGYSGSPGNTYYSIAPIDSSYIDQVTPINRTFGSPLQVLSIPNFFEINGITFSSSYPVLSKTAVLSIPDIYYWEGQDRVVPVDTLTITYDFSSGQGSQWGYSVTGSRFGTVYNGDSSGILLWKYNNILYLIGQTNTADRNPDLDGYHYAAGSLRNSNIFPVYNYVFNTNRVTKNHVYNPNPGNRGALIGDINNMCTTLQTAITNALAKITEVSG
tara:strand:+ start:2724 stop:3872 length:1149 start_codon:yes stop_codon:yes gene_type:complete